MKPDIFLTSVLFINGILASYNSDSEVQDSNEPTLSVFDEFRNFSQVVKISEFLKQSDVKNLTNLSKALITSRIPQNLSYLSFFGKQVFLPEYLSEGPDDFAFFNRYDSNQLSEGNFWMTIIHVCNEGLELNSCRSSARYAANQFIEYQSDQQMIEEGSAQHLIDSNLDKIFILLIKYGDYDIIKKMFFVERFRLNARVHEIINEDRNENLFRSVTLSIENVDEQRNFISFINNSRYWFSQIVILAMDLHPDMLSDITINEVLVSKYDRREVILHFSPGHDAETNDLIYNFKRSLNGEEGNINYQSNLDKIIEYHHHDTPLINGDERFPSDELYELCLAAIEKRDAETLIQLFPRELQTYFFEVNYTPMREKITEALWKNPEMFKGLLPAIRNCALDNYVIKKGEELFKSAMPQDEKAQNILQVIIDNYENNPGIQFGLFIFPGIQDKDLDSLLSYLVENPIYLQGRLREIINTVLLIETDSGKIQRLLETLVSNIPDVNISEVMYLIMEKASFRCIYELLQNPIFTESIQKQKFKKLNWNYSDIRRIFQNDLMFNAFYPLRDQIWSAIFESFDVEQILKNFVTHSEVKSYLNFFQFYKIPKLNYEFECFNAVERNDYNLLFEFCESNIELALEIMNSASLIYYIPKHQDVVETILKRWLYEAETRKLQRVVDMISNVQFEKQIFIKVDSLNINSFQAFYSFKHNSYSGIRLLYKVEDILREFEEMRNEDVDEIFRKMSQCPHVYEQVIGPYKRIVDKLETYKQRCPYFRR